MIHRVVLTVTNEDHDVSRAQRSAPNGVSGVMRGAGALIDQCIVSGASFGTVVILSRFAGQQQLGIYALAFSLLVLVTGIQTALILNPYTVFFPREPGPQRVSLTGSALIQSAIFGLVASVLFLAGYAALKSSPIDHAWIALAISITLPAILLRNAVRRVCFAQLRFGQSIVIDSIAVLARFVILGVLVSRGELSAWNALMAIGLSDAIASTLYLLHERSAIGIEATRWKPDAVRNWRFGRWTALSQTVFITQTYSVHWLLGVFYDTAAIGGYMMCTSIVQLAGPLVQGAGNGITPLIANAYADGGLAHLARSTWKCAIWVGTATLVYLTIMFFGSSFLLSSAYGDGLEAYENVLIVLAFGFGATAIGMPVSKALTVLERPNLNFAINLGALLITAVVASAFAVAGNLFGAASGVCIGFATASVLRWATYFRVRGSYTKGKQ